MPFILGTWLVIHSISLGCEWLRQLLNDTDFKKRHPSTIFLRKSNSSGNWHHQRNNSGYLPACSLHPIFVPETPCFGVDLGGTLCKIAYLEKFPTENESAPQIAFRNKIRMFMSMEETYGETGFRDYDLEFDSDELGGHVSFTQFETRKMTKFIDQCHVHQVVDSTTEVYGTGGGARKYSQKIKELLNVSIHYCDELQSLISGINFMLKRDPEALYRVDDQTYKLDGQRIPTGGDGIFPYLLVNIGSGVSILEVTEDGNHRRVGGTSLGGATFFGLCALITGCSKFSEAMEFALKGDSKNIDLLIRDIYGGDYLEYGLSQDTVASSLGKLVRPEVRQQAKQEDVCRAILEAITNNVGSLAHLHARNEGITRVVFSGNFLRGNTISVARLSYAMRFWSNGERNAMFLRHEGYMGAVGAMLSRGIAMNKSLDDQHKLTSSPSSPSSSSTPIPSSTSPEIDLDATANDNNNATNGHASEFLESTNVLSQNITKT